MCITKETLTQIIVHVDFEHIYLDTKQDSNIVKEINNLHIHAINVLNLNHLTKERRHNHERNRMLYCIEPQLIKRVTINRKGNSN